MSCKCYKHNKSNNIKHSSKSTQKAKYFAISCIDYRFLDDILKELGPETYDQFILAGASLGINVNSNWRDICYEHIDFGISLHGIDTIIVFDHIYCGYYKYIYGKDDPLNHEQNMLLVKKFLEKKYPDKTILTQLLTFDMNHNICNLHKLLYH